MGASGMRPYGVAGESRNALAGGNGQEADDDFRNDASSSAPNGQVFESLLQMDTLRKASSLYAFGPSWVALPPSAETGRCERLPTARIAAAKRGSATTGLPATGGAGVAARSSERISMLGENVLRIMGR